MIIYYLHSLKYEGEKMNLIGFIRKVGLGFCFVISMTLIATAMLTIIILSAKYTSKPEKVSDAISICNEKYLWYKDEQTCKRLLRTQHGIIL